MGYYNNNYSRYNINNNFNLVLWCSLQFAILFIILGFDCSFAIANEVSFGMNYVQTWGGDHLTVLDSGKQVQLLLDLHSGAGFNSKKNFGSGHFGIKMKMPSKNAKGVLTTFYLTSVPIVRKNPGGPGNHDEVDIEFLGGNGKPHILSTNVFANDIGYREQQFRLWFDPTQDFHIYEIIWNQYQITFLVDKIPIRVYKKLNGVNYPSNSMHIEASIWNFTAWQGEVDWSQAPFIANYRGFKFDGCEFKNSNPKECYSQNYYWNTKQYQKLNPMQQTFLDHVRQKYMVYDYCADKSKHFKECTL